MKKIINSFVGKTFEISGEDPNPYPKPYNHGLCELEDTWENGGPDCGFRVVPVGSDKGYIYPGFDRIENISQGFRVVYKNAFWHEGFVNLVGPK